MSAVFGHKRYDDFLKLLSFPLVTSNALEL